MGQRAGRVMNDPQTNVEDAGWLQPARDRENFAAFDLLSRDAREIHRYSRASGRRVDLFAMRLQAADSRPTAGWG